MNADESISYGGTPILTTTAGIVDTGLSAYLPQNSIALTYFFRHNSDPDVSVSHVANSPIAQPAYLPVRLVKDLSCVQLITC
jgi:hypothetical protein